MRRKVRIERILGGEEGCLAWCEVELGKGSGWED